MKELVKKTVAGELFCNCDHNRFRFIILARMQVQINSAVVRCVIKKGILKKTVY